MIWRIPKVNRKFIRGDSKITEVIRSDPEVNGSYPNEAEVLISDGILS